MKRGTIEMRKALSTIDLAGSMNEFYVTSPYMFSHIKHGISLRVHFLSKEGAVNRKSYWLPATEAHCFTVDDRLLVFAGVKPEHCTLIAKFNLYQDGEGDFISKDDFADLQDLVQVEICTTKDARKNELKSSKGNVLRMEEQLGLFDPMWELDRVEASYGFLCKSYLGSSVYEAIVERYAVL